jgi:hypothetical protein
LRRWRGWRCSRVAPAKTTSKAAWPAVHGKSQRRPTIGIAERDPSAALPSYGGDNDHRATATAACVPGLFELKFEAHHRRRSDAAGTQARLPRSKRVRCAEPALQCSGQRLARIRAACADYLTLRLRKQSREARIRWINRAVLPMAVETLLICHSRNDVS